jgi:hypothetical protein
VADIKKFLFAILSQICYIVFVGQRKARIVPNEVVRAAFMSGAMIVF